MASPFHDALLASDYETNMLVHSNQMHQETSLSQLAINDMPNQGREVCSRQERRLKHCCGN
jgi:hypothetical protein